MTIQRDQAHPEPMAHRPMPHPDSARRDMAVVGFAMAILVILYWAATNVPVPGQ